MISNSEMLEGLERVLDFINERGVVPQQVLSIFYWIDGAIRLNYGEGDSPSYVIFRREEIEFRGIQRAGIKVVDHEGDVDPKLAKTLERLYEKANRAVYHFQESSIIKLFRSVPRDCSRCRQ